MNLLNELRKIDKIASWAFDLFFATSLNKFNNTGAGMIDSIYHMTLELLKKNVFFGINCIVWCENFKILPLSQNVKMNVNITKAVNH